MKQNRKNEAGASLVEYVLLTVCIAVIAVVSVAAMVSNKNGGGIKGKLQSAAEEVAGACRPGRDGCSSFGLATDD